jgi:hypothetical protein
VLRFPKPALSLLAGFVVVFASACGGSSGATNAPVGPGATSAPSVAAGNPNDPNSIITSAISGGAAIKSFHIKIEISGTIKKEILQSEGGSAGAAFTSDVKLDGTTLEGDVDVAGQGANLAFNVPPLAMLGNVPLTGGLVLKDNVLYYKVSLLGPKYTKMDLSSLSGLTAGLPVPTPAAAATLSLTDTLTQLKAQMDAAGIKATLVGVDQIGGKDANHINISFPLDKINAEIAASSPSPLVSIDSASVDLWVYKDNFQLAKVELKGASAAIGNIDFVLTITNYDAPVTITAPAASDVNPSK